MPGAGRYSVTLFDGKGAVLWQAEVPDTVVALPVTVRLTPGDKYFWSVRAKVAWDRWVESPLTEFGVLPGSRIR